eukprot:c19254_g1_i2 orf=165-1298(+)
MQTVMQCTSLIFIGLLTAFEVQYVSSGLVYGAGRNNTDNTSNIFWHSVDAQFTSWLRSVKSRVESRPHFFHFITKARHTTVKIVDLNGTGNFTSIQAAIDSIPIVNKQPVLIRIKAGTYVEKVVIPRTMGFISLQGEGRSNTVVVWNDTATGANSTFRSASVAVNSKGFTALNITFRNSAPVQEPGSVKQQAVAFRISGDEAAFYGCGFEAHQDTLYDHKGKHYFEDCHIEGSIDFIFGDGQSVYKNCELRVVPVTPGALTAQKRVKPDQDTGFAFLNCSISGSGLAYLGRAWGRYSRVVFLYTYMEDVIFPQGWYNWGDPKKEETVFYGQYKCSGPGASEIARVPWAHELTDEEAAPFLLYGGLAFINGDMWVPTL